MAFNFYCKIHRVKVQNLKSPLLRSKDLGHPTSGSIEQSFCNVLIIEILTLSILTSRQLIVLKCVCRLRMVELPDKTDNIF